MTITVSMPEIDRQIKELEEQRQALMGRLKEMEAQEAREPPGPGSEPQVAAHPPGPELRQKDQAELGRIEVELQELQSLRRTAELAIENALARLPQESQKTSLLPPDQTLATRQQLEEQDKEQKRGLQVEKHDLGEQMAESKALAEAALKQVGLTHTPHALPLAELSHPTDPVGTALLYSGMGAAALIPKVVEFAKEHGEDLSKAGSALWEAGKALDFNRDRAMAELAHQHRDDPPSQGSQMMEMTGRHQAEHQEIVKASQEAQRQAEQLAEQKYDQLRKALEQRIEHAAPEVQEVLRTALEDKIRQDAQLAEERARQARAEEIERMRRQHEREIDAR
jgi:hypothetical protein